MIKVKKQNKIDKDYWLKQKFGKLKLDQNQDLPDHWTYTSQNKFNFICDCGYTVLSLNLKEKYA